MYTGSLYPERAQIPGRCQVDEEQDMSPRRALHTFSPLVLENKRYALIIQGTTDKVVLLCTIRSITVQWDNLRWKGVIRSRHQLLLFRWRTPGYVVVVEHLSLLSDFCDDEVWSEDCDDFIE